MQSKDLYDLVKEAEQNDESGWTTSSTYVRQSIREDIDKTEAYLNSKHITGEKDSIGRPKPFQNIVVSHRNIWFRATDIDRKDIKFIAERAKDVVASYLMTIMLQEWMKKVNFGKFLNDWGLSLATHGSSVVEFVEQDGELIPSVLDWNNLIVDPIDFDGNMKIKKLWYTPAQLKKNKSYDKEIVKELLDNLQPRETVQGTTKDTKANYIEVYEVHGELPLSYLTDKESDEETYVHQMHVVTFQQDKQKSGFNKYTLFSGREAKSPQMITHLIPKDGQTYTGGAVKNLFEAQWMVNHSAKQIKDYLDECAKKLYQTADGNVVGQNTITDVEHGQIILHAPNQPITTIDTRADIAPMQSSKADWQNIANQINGIADSMVMQAKSGTAWRQTQAELQEAHSLFELMTENKGLYLEEMFREYIIPHFLKKLNTKDEISAILDANQITEFDRMYVPNEAIRRVNRKKKDTILSGQIYDPINEAIDMAEAQGQIQAELTGNQRFVKASEMDDKTWKEVFKDVKNHILVEITGEAKDIQGAMATLTSVLQAIAANPMMLQDPNAKMVFGKILELSGTVSPLELTNSQVQQPMQQPAMAPVGGAPMQPNQ